MESLIYKMKTSLETEFLGMLVLLEVWSGSEKVGGAVVWDGFLGLEPIDRVHMIREALRKTLTPDEYASVTIIVTFTKKEYKTMIESTVLRSEDARSVRRKVRTSPKPAAA